MDPLDERALNQTAFRRLQATLADTYKHGQFVAISGGQIIADAESFEEVRTRVRGRGIDPTKVLIAQAGADYPDQVVIFSLTRQS